jgi:hypothetical protein
MSNIPSFLLLFISRVRKLVYRVPNVCVTVIFSNSASIWPLLTDTLSKYIDIFLEIKKYSDRSYPKFVQEVDPKQTISSAGPYQEQTTF